MNEVNTTFTLNKSTVRIRSGKGIIVDEKENRSVVEGQRGKILKGITCTWLTVNVALSGGKNRRESYPKIPEYYILAIPLCLRLGK